MLITETFHGYIETTQDALLIFEGCRRGLLPRICRRLQERERKMIRSGSIFIFDERESGIKRWTDGRVWSPSRILGNFLIYRELDKKSSSSSSSSATVSPSSNQGIAPEQVVRHNSISNNNNINNNKERQLVGSLSDSYRFKHEGLIKKTMSILVNGVAQHLISYYDPQHVVEEKLRTPSSVPELASLEISPELLARQNFRVPPLVEPTFDPNDGNQQYSDSMAMLATSGMSDTASYDRRMHPLRSMSVGSLGPHNNNGMAPESYYTRVSATTSTTVDSRAQTSPSYGLSMSYNSINNNNQPSNLTPSPSTPMLSSTSSSSRNSFQHQRHYSASSLPRFDPRLYSIPIQRNSDQERMTPNLGQLLNPVHTQNQEAYYRPQPPPPPQQQQQSSSNNDNSSSNQVFYQRSSSLTHGEMPF